MQRDKSSTSKANSYEQIGEFWDSHDLTDFSDQIKKVNFDANIKSEKVYCAIDKKISKKVLLLASQRGVSPDVLVNLFLMEKLRSIKSTG